MGERAEGEARCKESSGNLQTENKISQKGKCSTALKKGRSKETGEGGERQKNVRRLLGGRKAIGGCRKGRRSFNRERLPFFKKRERKGGKKGEGKKTHRVDV